MQKYRIVPVEVTNAFSKNTTSSCLNLRLHLTDKTTSKDTVVDAVGEERARGIRGT